MITELPPGPEPKQPTVRRPAQSLAEHLAGFLAANNKSGFLPEDLQEGGPIMKLLDEQRAIQWRSEKRFKQVARDLQDLAAGTVTYCQALELVAATYGYRSYMALHAAARKERGGATLMFKNLRYEEPT